MTTDRDPDERPGGPTFRELHPVAKVFAVALSVVVGVLVVAVLALGARWGVYWFMRAWNAAG